MSVKLKEIWDKASSKQSCISFRDANDSELFKVALSNENISKLELVKSSYFENPGGEISNVIDVLEAIDILKTKQGRIVFAKIRAFVEDQTVWHGPVGDDVVEVSSDSTLQYAGEKICAFNWNALMILGKYYKDEEKLKEAATSFSSRFYFSSPVFKGLQEVGF